MRKKEALRVPPKKSNQSVQPLTAIDGPELVFGLVGAVGTDLDQVAEVLSEQLRRVSYRAHVIRISALLHEIRTKAFERLATKDFDSHFEKIAEHMEAGSTLRAVAGRGDILALMAITKIRALRLEHLKSSQPPAGSRTAYILRSLKHPDEIRALRDIYGRAFYVIAAYSPRETRISRLSARIAESVHSSDVTKYRSQAEELVTIDEREEHQLGQRVGDAFPLADAFVDARSKPGLSESIGRFIELVFGNPFHTPTRDEYAMFHAHASALRSADLSRQVGASITTEGGDIIAVGCNDVPKYGGGLYWPEDPVDGRDFRIGYDSNALFRRDLVTQLVVRLQEAGLFSLKLSRARPDAIARGLLRNKAFKETIAANVIEFGRSVHAEMAAISNAANRGTSLAGARMFSTTFPCHLCARHIVAAGIRSVVYIEPYPKSVAGQLYSDSIIIDPTEEIASKVIFRPFVGIAPAIYTEMFKMYGDRKGPSGKALEWTPTAANPKLRRFVLSYVLIEQQVVGELLPELLGNVERKLSRKRPRR